MALMTYEYTLTEAVFSDNSLSTEEAKSLIAGKSTTPSLVQIGSPRLIACGSILLPS